MSQPDEIIWRSKKGRFDLDWKDQRWHLTISLKKTRLLTILERTDYPRIGEVIERLFKGLYAERICHIVAKETP